MRLSPDLRELSEASARADSTAKHVPKLTDHQAERETVIRIGYDEDGTELVSIYSTQKNIWRKAERAGWKETMRDGSGREFEAPAAQFRFSLRTAESTARERDKRSSLLRARIDLKSPVTVGKSKPTVKSGGGVE